MRTVSGLLVASALAVVAWGASAQTEPIKGEVTRVDEANGRITIRHEPIPHLNMGPMNMVFRLASPSLLENLKVGDAVIFEADRVDGAITLLRVEKAPPAGSGP